MTEILEALYDGPLDAARLADRLRVPAATVERDLAGYAEGGYVVPPRLSGRWNLTPRGRQTVDALRAVRNPAPDLRSLLAAFDEVELACSLVELACEAQIAAEGVDEG